MLKVHFTEDEISIEIVDFDPHNTKHQTVAKMLQKAKFSEHGLGSSGTWYRDDDLEQWRKQCEALVVKVGGQIIDRRSREPEKGNNVVPFLSKEPEGQIAEERIAALELEVKRLGELGAIAENELQRLESLLKSLQ